ncbi:MAG TPA: nitrilase-related carbon-nitrogen hydrolase [Puia sp.]|nr:nitrilase-related carbon-nitrogen hydrolase [Puia sp.]
MKSYLQSIIWLMPGTILMFFSNGRWIIPLATWIYPVFFLHFLSNIRPLKGFILLFIATAMVNIITWWKMIPLPIPIYLIITGIAFQINLLPYLADRLIATRINGFESTLIFPLSLCFIEYLICQIPSKGSWTALAYSQATNLTLMQLVSITGIWGLSFLIGWFASVLHWAWRQEFRWNIIRNGILIYVAIFALVIGYGSFQLNFESQLSKSVRIAAIVQSRNINEELKRCHWTDAQGVMPYSEEVENNLLSKTEEAAEAGAQFVLWQESAGFVPKIHEKEFIERAKNLAAKKKIYLLMTLWSIPEDFPQHKVENKLIVLTPEAKQDFTYFKSNPVSVEPIVKGNGKIPVIETEYGNISPAICFDDVFPGFIRQAGKNGVGIMFIPANDWKEIDPIHTYMAITRAIENGFSLVRPAGNGLSVATDNRGRIISRLDYYHTEEQVMYADIPSSQSKTIYVSLGDFFPWCCLVGFLIFFVKMLIKNPAHIQKDFKKVQASAI